MAQQDVGAIPIAELLQRVKDRLAARGVTGINSLGTRFRIMDDNGNRQLDKAEFSKALTELGITVNKTVRKSSFIKCIDARL